MAANSDVYAHWRDSARMPRLFVVDARGALFIMVCLLHMVWWTFTIAGVGLAVLGILAYFKLPLGVAVRVLISALAGKHKHR